MAFMLRVNAVLDSENEMWRDPHSCWETDGLRRRRWFSIERATEVLKPPGKEVLDALATVAPTDWASQRYRILRLQSRPRIFLFHSAMLSTDQANNESCKTCEAAEAACHEVGCVIRAEFLDLNFSAQQCYALNLAMVRASDYVIIVSVSTANTDEALQVGWLLGVVALIGCPTLFLHGYDLSVYSSALVVGDKGIITYQYNSLMQASAKIAQFLAV